MFQARQAEMEEMVMMETKWVSDIFVVKTTTALSYKFRKSQWNLQKELNKNNKAALKGCSYTVVRLHSLFLTSLSHATAHPSLTADICAISSLSYA